MLYNTKLNEFEPEQIDMMLALIKTELKAIIESARDVYKWDESELKDRHQKRIDLQIETMLLWKVQLENAKSDIKEMNKINAG